MEYAVVERRLAPGHAAEYLEATEAFAEALRGARGYLAARSYLSEEDPDSALEVSRWLRRADRVAAMPNVPAARQDTLDRLSREESSVRWFSAAREITTFGVRPGYVAAVLQQVSPSDFGAHAAWVCEIQDRSLAADLVVSQGLLTTADEPGLFLTIAEYRQMEHRQQVLALVRAHPPPRAPLVRRSFVGRIGYSWERPPPGTGSALLHLGRPAIAG